MGEHFGCLKFQIKIITERAKKYKAEFVVYCKFYVEGGNKNEEKLLQQKWHSQQI